MKKKKKKKTPDRMDSLKILLIERIILNNSYCRVPCGRETKHPSAGDSAGQLHRRCHHTCSQGTARWLHPLPKHQQEGTEIL